MADFSDEIERRKINQHNVFLFSLFAGMVEMSLVNQGIVNEVTKVIADNLIKYYEALGEGPNIITDSKDGNESTLDNIKSIFDFFNNELNLVKEYSIEQSDGFLKLFVKSDLCKVCPKGLGGADLKGSLCIIPHLSMHLINHYLPAGVKITLKRDEPALLKEHGNCISNYEFG